MWHIGFLVPHNVPVHALGLRLQLWAVHPTPHCGLGCTQPSRTACSVACSVLDFGEVTTLFRQLAPQQSVESARNAAVEALLLADQNTDSRLNKREFGQLLTK